MARYVHRMPFGAQVRPGGNGADFRLWAPAARRVDLVLPGAAERTIAAKPEPGGWFSAAADDVRDGTHYLWQIDGGQRVPDPASRFNPRGPHGPSQLVDPDRFEWSEGDWRGRPWHEAVLYELHVGTFTREGTYAAAEAQLGALAALGVTAVELLPLADFPGHFGWGYDGVLPYAPHAAYGTPNDLKRFVQSAHRHGLMVFIDVVYNHFGPDGNYLHLYAPQFFTDRHHTPWGAAINFDGEQSRTVREFFIHNALYWVDEFRVDGLRFDAVHQIVDDSTLHFLEELSTRLRAASAGRHVHLVLENECNDARRLGPPGTPGRYEAQWNDDFHHAMHVLLTGEQDGYYAEFDRPMEQLARTLTAGFARERCDSDAFTDATGEVPLANTVISLQNHDQIGNRAFGERLSMLASAESLRLAAAMHLLAPAPPMLFMGEEFGATTPFLHFANWEGELREAVREGRRREFARFPRFAEAAARNELPDSGAPETFQRCKLSAPEQQSPPEQEWRTLYRELLALRHRILTPRLERLATGRHSAERIGERGLHVRWRFDDGLAFDMLVQLGEDEQRTDGLTMAPLVDGETLHTVGDVQADRLGAWSGRWSLGHEAG
jgi:maltooligosyltrehalose trehalohydrolase